MLTEGEQKPDSVNSIKAPVRLSPVIKVVSAGCNLRCPYCFYAGHQPEIKVMSNETAEIVTQKLIDASPKSVTFIWHGGEPTIAGIDFYEKVISL